MKFNFSKLTIIITMLLLFSLLLAACGGQSAPAEPPPQEPAAEEPAAEEPAAEEPAAEEPAAADDGERVEIRWFVGLGTGTDPEQIPQEEALVEEFNNSQDRIKLVIEFVVNEQASDQLKTQVAAGNPPDIVGPVGQSGVNTFEGLFLDLEPHLARTNYDWNDFNEGSINAYRLEEGTYGIPFAIFPSMIYYNRDLFDEAGLDYPPHEYGEPYADGDPWTVEKLEELSMKLTVDANGNDANSPDFDPEEIVQFGFHTQWTLPRGEATALFGADSLVDESGNAVISDRWRDAFHWYYDGIHTKHFMPNQTYQDSELLAAGNVFNSGNVAMAHVHLWYTCCLGEVENWDMAAIPTYNEAGDVTSKLHADTFRIFESSKHPEEAFEVMTWLVGDAAGDLLQIYGGMPARQSIREDFFAGLDETFAAQEPDWQVAIDGLAYPDIPNHEANMPNYAKAFDRMQAFQNLYRSDPGLDLDAELDTLQSELQSIFDEVK